MNRAPFTPWGFVVSRGLLTATALVVLTVSAVLAQEEAPPADPPPVVDPAAPVRQVDPRPDTPTPDPRPDDPEFDGVAGRIVEIGERAIVVLPNDSRRKVTFRVPEGARILLNRERAALSNLKVGDQVRVTLAARGSDLAREVLVARLAPNPNPRPAPVPRGEQPEQPGLNVEVSETRRSSDAGMGLVVTAAPNGGVLVVDAQEDSPADRAGLRAGDLVVSFEGDDLLSPQEFVNRVREKRPGEKVSLIVTRGAGAIKGDVSLVRREAAPDVIVRRPISAAQPGAVDNVAVERELDVATGAPAAVPVPAGNVNGVNGQPAAGDLQRIEQTLQVLLQEIRALRQELRGNGAAPQNRPAATGNQPNRKNSRD